MSDIKNLYERIAIEKETIRKYKPEIIELPKYIVDNLKYVFFDWQKEAFENLLVYTVEHQINPTHLMFNMATGTGKTLLMAATILYYYQQGYRHFLFFVNQKNIIDKTENNFIDNSHSKYLFNDKIVIDDKTVNVKKVDNFSDALQGIEIKFTSIQKLYNDIHLQRENQTTLDDLQSKNIVMLADEAHHLNTDTKRIKQAELPIEITGKTSKEEVEKRGWEHTVIKLILEKSGQKKDNKNVLLEFTATIPTIHKGIEDKYSDKIIYKFGLKEFLQAGYTKEINLISSTLNKKERVLQALLFQWYRHEIALKHGIANFKPVILFRSKTIEESRTDHEKFNNWISDISSNDFDFFQGIANKVTESESPNEQGKSRIEQILKYIKTEKINYSEIASWIKQNFKENNVIITNSKINKKNTEETDEQSEKLLNNLEDKNNHVRAIFTVMRLTEGWDVLNLYDIVRLYDGRDESKDTSDQRVAGTSTVAEKQLIGRGVRYFPFTYKDTIRNKRKFDNDLQNELRILEELYFYSTNDHRYISELKNELKKDGYIEDNRTTKSFQLKPKFQDSDFYKNTKIWYNKQIDNPHRKKKNLNDIKKNFYMEYKIQGAEFYEQEIDFSKQDEDKERLTLQEGELYTFSIKIKEIEKHIFLKALNIKAKQENSLFQFENIHKELDIESIDDLQTKILADFEINITSEITCYEQIENKDKLAAVLTFLDKLAIELKSNIAPKIGSDFIAGNFKEFFSEPKEKTINEDNLDDSIANDNEWYVLDGFVGTSEELKLIEFIKERIGNLKRYYKEIYLLRNEEVYKIYDFQQGRGFQPDFILFLKSRKRTSDLYYQIFIEPKGNQFIGNDGTFKTGKDGWKEEFLDEISKRYGFNEIMKAENSDYRLIGLPFFNDKKRTRFEMQFGNLFNSKK